MGARKQTELIPWTDYLMSANPALPYLALFKAMAELAFVALGGDDIDLVLDQARLTVDTWTAGQQRPPDDKAAPRPVSHREAGSARTAIAKQGEAKRRLFERGCDVVARLFHDVLKRHAFDRREASQIEPDAPPAPPEDPALEEAIKARAPNFMLMAGSRAGRPGVPHFDAEREAELAALRKQQREMEVHMIQMGMGGDASRVVVGPEHATKPDSDWAGAAAQREPVDMEVTAFCLALMEGDESAFAALPAESLEKVKELQKWFAAHDTRNAPRALVAAFVRRKFNQVFDARLLREAAKRSMVGQTAQGV